MKQMAMLCVYNRYADCCISSHLSGLSSRYRDRPIRTTGKYRVVTHQSGGSAGGVRESGEETPERAIVAATAVVRKVVKQLRTYPQTLAPGERNAAHTGNHTDTSFDSDTTTSDVFAGLERTLGTWTRHSTRTRTRKRAPRTEQRGLGTQTRE